MTRGITLVFRLVGAFVGAYLALSAVAFAVHWLQLPATAAADLGALLAGALLGGSLGPRLIWAAQSGLNAVSADELMGLAVGFLTGALAGLVLAAPLLWLATPLAPLLAAAVTLTLAYLGAATLYRRPHDLIVWLRQWQLRANAASAVPTGPGGPKILLDTSVIIDGRISDISKTGFLSTALVVPNFVLNELQYIADSADSLRRKRGRRGLEVLNVLRTDCPIPLEVTDVDVSEVRDVDGKLVALARHFNCPIMTNDYNLNRVAGLQGVRVLNINDLANAVKAAFLPGEEVEVRVIQEGREHGQGVGYLDDGTMVVIDDGRYRMNETVNVVVTKVLQTSAGRMIFARIP